jgi:hypothetical protein
MPKKKTEPVEQIEELNENEQYLSSDDIDIEVAVSADEVAVYVKFAGFSDMEDAEEYAEFLAETLPLLLFETTKVQ